jgi:hypothetical protein
MLNRPPCFGLSVHFAGRPFSIQIGRANNSSGRVGGFTRSRRHCSEYSQRVQRPTSSAEWPASIRFLAGVRYRGKSSARYGSRPMPSIHALTTCCSGVNSRPVLGDRGDWGEPKGGISFDSFETFAARVLIRGVTSLSTLDAGNVLSGCPECLLWAPSDWTGLSTLGGSDWTFSSTLPLLGWTSLSTLGARAAARLRASWYFVTVRRSPYRSRAATT